MDKQKFEDVRESLEERVLSVADIGEWHDTEHLKDSIVALTLWVANEKLIVTGRKK